MPTELERIETLEKQMAGTCTRAQAEALVAVANANVVALSQTVGQLQSLVNQLVSEMNAMKKQVADHELRIIALEP